jgi:hypothetical protein
MKLFEIHISNGFRKEYHSEIEANSVRDARAKWLSRCAPSQRDFSVRESRRDDEGEERFNRGVGRAIRLTAAELRAERAVMRAEARMS